MSCFWLRHDTADSPYHITLVWAWCERVTSIYWRYTCCRRQQFRINSNLDESALHNAVWSAQRWLMVGFNVHCITQSPLGLNIQLDNTTRPSLTLWTFLRNTDGRQGYYTIIIFTSHVFVCHGLKIPFALIWGRKYQHTRMPIKSDVVGRFDMNHRSLQTTSSEYLLIFHKPFDSSWLHQTFSFPANDIIQCPIICQFLRNISPPLVISSIFI